MSKPAPDSNIHDSESPRAILKRLGVKDEASHFVPELPDYLGYVIGLLLLWLLYTGYQAMVGMMSDTRSRVGRISRHVSDIGAEAIHTAKGAIADRANDMEPPDTAGRGVSWRAMLESINTDINGASHSVADYIHNAFSNEAEPPMSRERENEREQMTAKPVPSPKRRPIEHIRERKEKTTLPEIDPQNLDKF